MAEPPNPRADDARLVATRVPLEVESSSWRLLATVNTVGVLAVALMVAVGGALTYGVVTAAAVALVVVLLSPLLWLAAFARRAARAEGWIEVDARSLTIHHPVYFAADLCLERDIVHGFVAGDVPDAPGSVRPSVVAPDLASATGGQGWNFVLLLRESYFLARVPRPAIRWVNFLSRGTILALAPAPNYWVRGFFGVVPDPELAAGALTGAGIHRTELTPEVVEWLGVDPPVPLARAWRNYRRDRRRRQPGRFGAG